MKGNMAQLLGWAYNTPTNNDAIWDTDYALLYNGGAGLTDAELALTLRGDGLPFTDRLYHHYDFGDISLYPKFYNKAVLGDGLDYIEMVDKAVSGPEDILTPFP